MQFDQKRRDQITLRNDAAIWLHTHFVAKLINLRSEFVLAAGLAGLALLLRLHGLSDKPFWYDEVLTWGRAKLPLAELVVNALKHKHFPTYFLLVAPFYSAHHPEWMLRLPSALFGAACVFLVARIAIAVRGPWAGVVAGLLMALSPIEVQFAQEARAYTLISCLVLTAVWGLVAVAQGSERATSPDGRTASTRGAWIAYTLGTLGALLVENNTVPWLLASNVAILVIVLRAATGRRALLRNWAWSQAIIVLVWLPALVTMLLLNPGAVLDGLEWIPKATWRSAQTAAEALYLFRIPDLMTMALFPSPLPEFGILVAIIAFLGAWRLKSNPNVLAVIGLALLAMPLAVLAVDAFQPLLVPRYLLWSTGPFFVLAGIGAAFAPRFSAPIAVSVALGGALCLAPYYSAETRPRWDQTAAYLAANIKPHDVIVAQNPAVMLVLAAYAERVHLRAETPILSWDPRHPLQELPQGGRAWAVYGRAGQGPQKPEAEFRRDWSAFGTPDDQVRIGSSILILRFDNSSPSPLRSSRALD
jgi:mannosyltransferase